MKTIEIIVMGKTGAGKSTLINSVLDENLAPIGVGQAVTKKNQIYSKKILLPLGEPKNNQYGMIGCKVNMYDTVGLEIDNIITDSTLAEIQRHIEETKAKTDSSDIHLVWFCVNDRSSRFEKYELELIRKLSIEYEIPFVIVLTQCYSDNEGDLEKKIRTILPEVTRKRVLAKNYKTRGGEIVAFGIPELLRNSVLNYSSLKVDLLERKLNSLDEGRTARIKQIEEEGKQIISNYESAATKIGFVPGGCIPIVHGICIKMIADLNSAAGFKTSKNFAEDVFVNVIVGAIVTPFMIIPILSAAVAAGYVGAVGENYLKAMLNVINLSSDRELTNNALIKERLKHELSAMKK